MTNETKQVRDYLSERGFAYRADDSDNAEITYVSFPTSKIVASFCKHKGEDMVILLDGECNTDKFIKYLNLLHSKNDGDYKIADSTDNTYKMTDFLQNKGIEYKTYNDNNKEITEFIIKNKKYRFTVSGDISYFGSVYDESPENAIAFFEFCKRTNPTL